MKQGDSETRIRAIVVDDESLARKGLTMRLAQFPDLEVVQVCKNGKEALAAIAEQTPDLVFLDIQMPGITGLEVVEQLQQDNMPMIVFVTAYDAFAIDAFKANAVDYLLKPIEETRLSRTVERVREIVAGRRAAAEKERLLEIVIGLTGKSRTAIDEWVRNPEEKSEYADRLAIKDGSATTFVPVRDIDWVDAAGDYMCVHVQGQTYIMRTTMKELEAQLDPKVFQRVHRSTIVNLQRVEKVSSHINGEFHLTLSCGSSLKMSRSYKDKVKHFF
ncbi:MAG: response regulator [Pseudomonadales bacterium]|nr:response regulator [Pseudomonadales bacterium]MCP5358578.1 response regulator [Pseudomonadales bacterium]